MNDEEVCMVRGGFRQWVVLGFLVFVAACFESAYAQAPAGRGGAPQQPRIYANMVQLMRGTLYPQSNVIFTAQVEDPASFKPAAHQSTSSDPFTSAYGGWEAVENSGLAMAETAALLLVPRQCSNGKPAPVQNAIPVAKAAGEAEIVAGVKATIAEMGSPTMKDMGTVMKAAMARLAGKPADGRAVSEAVKARLQ